jgi:hypothetical protein
MKGVDRRHEKASDRRADQEPFMKNLLLSTTALALGLALAGTASAARGGGRISGPSYSGYSRPTWTPSYTPRYATTTSFTVRPTFPTGTHTLSATTFSRPTVTTRLPLTKSALAAQRSLFSGRIASGRYLARNFRGFQYRCWSPRWGCYLFWCSGGWFYFYEPCGCYLPYYEIVTYAPCACVPPVDGGLPPVVPGGFDAPPGTPTLSPGDVPPGPGDPPGIPPPPGGPAGPGGPSLPGGPTPPSRMPPADDLPPAP